MRKTPPDHPQELEAWLAGCKPKRRFTETEARLKAALMNRARSSSPKPRQRDRKMSAYPCPWCDNWHIGGSWRKETGKHSFPVYRPRGDDQDAV